MSREELWETNKLYIESRWRKSHTKGSRVDNIKAINALAVVHNSVLVSTELHREERKELLKKIRTMHSRLKGRHEPKSEPVNAKRTFKSESVPFRVIYDKDTSFVYT